MWLRKLLLFLETKNLKNLTFGLLVFWFFLKPKNLGFLKATSTALFQYRLTPPLQGTPANIRINLILPVISYIYIFVADSMGLSSFKFSWWAPKHACILKQSAKWPFKVIDIGTNRKRVCDFLLVISSDNLGLVFLRFRDIAGFLLRRAAPPPFYPYFCGVALNTLRLDCRWCGSEERRS